MLAQQSMRRLTRELVRLQKNAPDGIAVEVGEQDLLDIDGWIQGPAGTPYAGGFFRVHFDFQASSFPAAPPRCTMRTKIFHPNIHSNGEICVSTLKKDWSSTYGVEHILLVIKCLLISPNPDSALDPEAGRLLQEDYDEYAATASIWTRIHASQRPTCMANVIAGGGEELLKTVSSSSSSPSTACVDAVHASKKMSEDVNDMFSLMTLESDHCTLASAQPLARSGSANVNLHKKPSFTMAPQGAVGVAGTGVRRPSCGTTLGTSAAKMNVLAPAMIETGSGGAAAAATSAAMTAMITAEMKRVSLHGNPDSPTFFQPISPTSLTPQLPNIGSMTWPTRRRQTAVVRRGIKRL